MDRGHFSVCITLLVALLSDNSECFIWTQNPQSSIVINAYIGSDITLPCDFLLTPEDESAMQRFHLIYWSKEVPTGSQSWQGLAVRTSLISNSEPQIIYRDKSHIFMKNNSLKILNLGVGDEGQYQCEVKSSFYTKPFLIKLKTQYSLKSNKQNAPLSSGASAGIGVGATLTFVCIIVFLGGLYLFKRKGKRVEQEATNLATVSRFDARESHVGPGFPGTLEVIAYSIENQYCTMQEVDKTVV